MHIKSHSNTPITTVLHLEIFFWKLDNVKSHDNHPMQSKAYTIITKLYYKIKKSPLNIKKKVNAKLLITHILEI